MVDVTQGWNGSKAKHQSEVANPTPVGPSDRPLGGLSASILEAFPRPLAVLSPGSKLMAVNLSFQRSFGTAGIDLTGRSLFDVIGEERDTPHLKQILDNLYSGGPSDRVTEHEFRLPGGCGVAIVTARRIEGEGMPLVLLLVEDITERRRHDRRRDEFVITLVHELRNPLAAIDAALRILRTGGEREHRRVAEKLIGRQVKNMTRLVEDLMEASLASRGKVRLRKEPASLGPIVARAVETVRPLLEGRSQQIRVSLDPGALHLEADSMRLERVFVNLLTNASKYGTESGCISLSAGRESGQIVVRVKDDGQGIPPHMLRHVFEMFSQVERTLDLSKGGLGIGLAVVQQLVALHGGSVSAASDGPGRGSEFTVCLPPG